MTSTKLTTKDTAKLLLSYDNIAIIAHVRPDGDTLGASLALRHSLVSLGKHVSLYCEDIVDSRYINFDIGFDLFTNQQIDTNATLLVSVDCGDLGRLGGYGNYYSRFSNTLTIDHHGGQYFSRYNCLCTTASTCEIVWDIVSNLNVTVTKAIAISLYIGMCTDTGNFSYSNADSQCFAVASQLVKYGVEVEHINRVFFKNMSKSRAMLQWSALSRVRLYHDDRVALVYVNKVDFDKAYTDIADTEGLVQLVSYMDCVDVAICIAQHNTNSYKISLRSKNINVRNIAESFGGGGHKFASGCMLSGFFEDVVEKIVRAVGLELC